MTETTETYSITLTPHFGKYQDQDQTTADLMQITWNFGNILKSHGYKVAYMHGPTGLYEGMPVVAETMHLETTTFEEEFPDKDQYIFFLYQKLVQHLRFGKLRRADVEARRKQLNIKRPKKVVDVSDVAL